MLSVHDSNALFQVSMTIFPQEFHEDDEYNRDCTAFKVSSLGSLKLHRGIGGIKQGRKRLWSIPLNVLQVGMSFGKELNTTGHADVGK